jgi:hypothetical protein
VLCGIQSFHRVLPDGLVFLGRDSSLHKADRAVLSLLVVNVLGDIEFAHEDLVL